MSLIRVETADTPSYVANKVMRTIITIAVAAEDRSLAEWVVEVSAEAAVALAEAASAVEWVVAVVPAHGSKNKIQKSDYQYQ